MVGGFDINNLFAIEANEKIEWALHTTYNSDPLYQLSLMAKQIYGNELNISEEDICWGDVLYVGTEKVAFFYNNTTPPTIKRTIPNNIPLSHIKNFQYLLEGNDKRQTFHAKISFLCISNKDNQPNKYRLAIYSKNHTFSKNLEVASVFDLDFTTASDISRENGKQLKNFFKHLHDSTSGEGQTWLNGRGLINPGKNGENKSPDFKNVTLRSQFFPEQEDISIYFGGCDDGPTLGAQIEFQHINTEKSIILTPPEFIRGTVTQTEYFDKNKILYDLKNDIEGFDGSHAKLYLLQKPGNNETEMKKYELWLGSANATRNGLGWDFQNKKSTLNNKEASVECLVKIPISEDLFKNLEDGLRELYEPFNFKKGGSLNNYTRDIIGQLFYETFKVSLVEYLEKTNSKPNKECKNCNSKYIRYTFEIKNNEKFESLKEKLNNLDGTDDRLAIRPIEYRDQKNFVLNECLEKMDESNKLSIEYNFDKFRPPQKILAIGKSEIIMYIDDELYRNIPTVEIDILTKNIPYMNKFLDCEDDYSLKELLEKEENRLIKLLGKNEKYGELKNKIKWIYNTLVEGD